MSSLRLLIPLHLLETSTHASIVLLSSTLDDVACMMLDPQLCSCACVHVHILADHVTLLIG